MFSTDVVCRYYAFNKFAEKKEFKHFYFMKKIRLFMLLNESEEILCRFQCEIRLNIAGRLIQTRIEFIIENYSVLVRYIYMFLLKYG